MQHGMGWWMAAQRGQGATDAAAQVASSQACQLHSHMVWYLCLQMV